MEIYSLYHCQELLKLLQIYTCVIRVTRPDGHSNADSTNS